MIKYNLTEFSDELEEGITVSTINTGRTRVQFHAARTIWTSRSILERVLIVFCLTFFTTILLLLVLISRQDTDVMFLHLNHNSQHDPAPHCLSPECVRVAASMLRSMDGDVDPCNDFYQYACGGWREANPIPHGQSVWNTFGNLWKQNQLVIKNVLESPSNQLVTNAERKAQLYYQSCMDGNGTAEKRGGRPLAQLLDKLGGWNISGGPGIFDPAQWDFQRSIRLLHNRYNAAPLFSWSISADDKNSTVNVIQIDQTELTLPSREYYINKSTANDPVLSAYLEYLTRIGVLLGGDEPEVRRQANDVITLETELANIITPPDQRRDEQSIYHKMTVTELQATANFIDWLEFFSDAMSLVNITLEKNFSVVVYAPIYLKKLTILVNKYLATLRGKITLNNFLMVRLGSGLVHCLSRQFRDAYKTLKKALIGTSENPENWMHCVDDTNSAMGFALGAMFVRQKFHSVSKQLAEEMITDIRRAFIDNTKQLAWMDEETRRLAEEKADAIRRMIGYPYNILDADYLNEKYGELEINEEQYFENNIRLAQYALIKNLEKFGKVVNKTRWDMTPPSVNAYYSASHNMIVFPAGILQAPFYDLQYPRSLNFGAIGVVMGHELTHAFDDQGREFDKHGNMKQWWNNVTIERFKTRAACMVQQYNQYKVGNQSVNGRQTLGENIADNGGLKAAFKAYSFYRKHHGEEKPLPGLNLTHSQLFFLGFAQVWCSSATPESERMTALNDNHAPARYRVIGPLSNSPDFAHEFRCPLGSKMNPIDKCEVW